MRVLPTLTQMYDRYVNYWETVGLPCHDFTATTLPLNTSKFVIAGSAPQFVTVGAQSLTTANGMPVLALYNRYANLISETSAISINADGTQATFPFPKNASGGALTSDIYGVAITNWEQAPQQVCEPVYDEWGNYIGDNCWEDSGIRKLVSINYFAVGNPTIQTSPFGVDATTTDTTGTECTSGDSLVQSQYSGTNGAVVDRPAPGDPVCTDYSNSSFAPITTLSTSGQVSYLGRTLGVGANPTAIKVFGSQSQTTTMGVPGSNYWKTETVTRPAKAVVVNTGSNSVNTVDLVNWQVVATISVGQLPVSVTLNSNQTKAYVANFGSSSVSEIDLATNTVARTVTTTVPPAAIAVDGTSNVLWVGGQGFLAKVALDTFSQTATYAINGTINSIAVSAGENKLVYGVLTNDSAPNSTYGAAITYPAASYSVRTLSASDMVTTLQISPNSASAYSTAYSSAPLPQPSIVANGSVGSTDYGNGISVSATPDGFVVMDVGAGAEIMRGTTPGPVRAIATDSRNGVAYLTVPDSNLLLTVPLKQ